MSEQSAQPSPADLSVIVNYWEGQRIWFNAVLAGVGIIGIVFSGVYLMGNPVWIILEIFVYAFLANICYSLGPYANILGVVKLGADSKPRKALFFLGLFGSSLLTLFFVFALSFPVANQ